MPGVDPSLADISTEEIPRTFCQGCGASHFPHYPTGTCLDAYNRLPSLEDGEMVFHTHRRRWGRVLRGDGWTKRDQIRVIAEHGTMTHWYRVLVLTRDEVIDMTQGGLDAGPDPGL